MCLDDPNRPAALIALPLAERLGWEVAPYKSIGNFIVGDISRAGANQMMISDDWFDIYAPGTPGYNFAIRIKLDGESVWARPIWCDQRRWTEEGRMFINKVNDLTDGMIVHALVNANQTACLDWLHHDPE